MANNGIIDYSYILWKIRYLSRLFFVIFIRETQKTSNFKAHLYVFEGEDGDKHTELASTFDLENPYQLPVKEVFEGIVMIVSKILSFFFVSPRNLIKIHVFEVKGSISDLPTGLSCFGDLENPCHLPVQEFLRGTDDFVLWIFTIFSVFMFSRSRNSFLTFLLSYRVWVKKSRSTSGSTGTTSEILVIVSYRFSQFLHYSYFWVYGIHCWHSYWAVMFGLPRNSRSTSGSGGIDDSVL